MAIWVAVVTIPAVVAGMAQNRMMLLSLLVMGAGGLLLMQRRCLLESVVKGLIACAFVLATLVVAVVAVWIGIHRLTP